MLARLKSEIAYARGLLSGVARTRIVGAAPTKTLGDYFEEWALRHGDRPAGVAAVREGLKIADATGEHMWDAELHRINGMVLLAENKLDEGQASLQQAIRIAQAQRAKSLELRAARDLSWLWGEQGRRAEARDLLTPVYGWFTEGFDTADLKEVKALLDELT